MIRKHILISIFVALTTAILTNSSHSNGSKTELKFLSDEQVSFNPSDTVIEFDSYVFAMQFPKVQCLRYGIHTCEKKLEIAPKNTFTIHGLWPNLNGRPIEECNHGENIPVHFDDLEVEKRAKKYWLSMKDDDESFWNHEYNKHGLCWTLKYGKKRTEEFFRVVLDLYKKLGFDSIIRRAGFNLDQPDSLQEFTYHTLMEMLTPVINMNFEVRCVKHEGKQYFGDLEISLDLNYESSATSVYTNCNKHEPIYIIFN